MADVRIGDYIPSGGKIYAGGNASTGLPVTLDNLSTGSGLSSDDVLALSKRFNALVLYLLEQGFNLPETILEGL